MDALNLHKGETLNLNKASTAPLKKISLGAGWDMATEGQDIDIDLSAAALTNGRLELRNLCYFNNKSILDGAVQSMGDNLTGEGDGDDETINVDLAALPADVGAVVFILNIFHAKERGQYFSGVENAFIRAYNTETGQELAKTSVSGVKDSFDNLIFAKVTRVNDEWEFIALQEFGNGDLGDIAKKMS
jgi:tellurium resistance protein TerD